MTIALEIDGRIINAASMATDIVSPPVNISAFKVIGVHCISPSTEELPATRAGTLYLDISNTGADADWVTLASKEIVTEEDFLWFADVADTGAKAFRVRYVAASGTGALTVIISRKK
jgi:hypothetical protein